jgi:hypothetical protein
MFVPHVGPLELLAILLMTLVTGIAWLADQRRRRGGPR